MNRRLIMASILLALPLVSCNIFDPLDSPSDDAQIRSAARACIDAGDFACARDWYSQLTSQTDRDRAEQAYMALDDAGVSMANFISAFGSGNNSAGQVITKLAGLLTSHASEANRVKIFAAYKVTAQMANGEQKGLLKFIAAIGLASMILAEEADVAGKLRRLDYVNNPDTCVAVNCPPPAGAKITDGGAYASPETLDAGTSVAGTPTIGMLRASFAEVQSGMTLMGINSNSNNAILNFASQLGSLADSATRHFLLENGVGE